MSGNQDDPRRALFWIGDEFRHALVERRQATVMFFDKFEQVSIRDLPMASECKALEKFEIEYRQVIVPKNMTRKTRNCF